MPNAFVKQVGPLRIRLISSLIGRTWSLESKAYHEFIPGSFSPRSGIALLHYRPENRLSISIWSSRSSRNIRIWGPKKLSFEKR